MVSERQEQVFCPQSINRVTLISYPQYMALVAEADDFTLEIDGSSCAMTQLAELLNTGLDIAIYRRTEDTNNT